MIQVLKIQNVNTTIYNFFKLLSLIGQYISITKKFLVKMLNSVVYRNILKILYTK